MMRVLERIARGHPCCEPESDESDTPPRIWLRIRGRACEEEQNDSEGEKDQTHVILLAILLATLPYPHMAQDSCLTHRAP